MGAQGSNFRGTRGSSRNRDDRQASPEAQTDGSVEDREARLVGEDPDVVLDVPMLNVEELDLEVEDLRAHVSVRAELANLVNINIGVDAYLDKVKLGLKGVEAQVLLTVKLERILGTIDQALNVLQQNPGLLDARLRESGPAGIEGSIGEPAGSSQGPTDEQPGPEGDTGEVQATDAARRKAEELGIDLSRVEGSGSGGRILVRDVKQAAG